MEFLSEISSYMEVVVYTASHREYADKVLDLIDPYRKLIRHRLYRESCTLLNGMYVKDLSKLNRDLSRSILVDNSPFSMLYNLQNGILVKSYEGDPSDNGLVYLMFALRSICLHNDLRQGIQQVIDN